MPQAESAQCKYDDLSERAGLKLVDGGILRSSALECSARFGHDPAKWRSMKPKYYRGPSELDYYFTVMTSDKATTSNRSTLGPGVRIGHVHLKVADIERSLGFYRDVLGFELTQRFGTQAAFLSAGGYHHHLGLNTWESAGGSPAAAGTTGLYHVAILYPTRAELADALRRLMEAGIQLDGASDHGVSEALYLRDPDGNGVELYWDRPREEWPLDAEGGLAMFSRPLDLNRLLREGK